MENIDAVQVDLHSQLSKLKEAYEKAVVEFEDERLDASLATANDIAEQISALLERFPTIYSKISLPQRFHRWEEVKERLQIPAGRRGKRDLLNDGYVKTLLELERSLSMVEREIMFLAPRHPWIARMAKRHAIRVIQVVGAAAALLLVIWGSRWFIGRGQGLMGSYYRGMDFESFVTKRLDHQVNFDWGRGGPSWQLPIDHFSIRWEGFVLVPRSGNYEFVVGSDDGSRLWIDDSLVIDQWKTQRFTRVKSPLLMLNPGLHKIKLEYFENGNLAAVDLSWRFENERNPHIISPKELVPSEKYLTR